jgi:hypothetical protein
MYMRYSLLLFLLVISLSDLLAQKQNNVWYFGKKAGVDFNGIIPQPLPDGKMVASEACASIADKSTGQLLFYTNGTDVWNRNHTLMPNGIGLAGNGSSSQGVVIVPDPGDDLKYYVFTTDAFENRFRKGLRYSMVDMRADSGRGDVIVKGS